MRGSPIFLSALMAEKVRSGLDLGRNILAGEKSGFCRGFCDFLVFCGGKSVVGLWWNAWWMWCFVWCFLAAKNMPTFSTLFFGIFPYFGNRQLRKEDIPQGLKAPNQWIRLETQGDPRKPKA